MRATVSTPFQQVPGKLPTDNIPREHNFAELEAGVRCLFDPHLPFELCSDAVWKDWLSLSPEVRTYNGATHIGETWQSSRASYKPMVDVVSKPRAVIQHRINTSWVSVDFSFSSRRSSGQTGINVGTASFTKDQATGSWMLWMLVTALKHFKGIKDPDDPPMQNRHQLKQDFASSPLSTNVVIVGAGQAGLSIAGRLHSAGIDYVLLEQKAKLGYGWWGKYDSVRQHTIKEYNNLPFDGTWSSNDPEYLPSHKVAEGFERFVARYKINLWRSSKVSSCDWLSSRQVWKLMITNGSGISRPIFTKHIIFTLGAGHAVPSVPEWASSSTFKGELMHSHKYKNSSAWTGKTGVVVGTGTTAHDIAQDMLNAGLKSVTMVQRKKTMVIPIEWQVKSQRAMYNSGVATKDVDMRSSLTPNKITHDILKRTYDNLHAAEQPRFDALERAGFRVDRDVGFLECVLGRYGGYYVDVGTSSRIAAGQIHVKSGSSILNCTERGLEFADGDCLPADVIVMATGYDHDYRNQVASIVGTKIAQQLGDFWGVDENGDHRGQMKQMYPGLWLLGGAAAQARFYSRFITLQLQEEFADQLQATNDIQSHL